MSPPPPSPPPPTDTFLKVCEIWEPDHSGKGLRLRSGIYGGCTHFQNATERGGFAWGEGLPGRAWAERKPIIWRDIDTLGFRRVAAARADGLVFGVALPLFINRTLVAVVVFFCGGPSPQFGAIEVWSPMPHDPETLRLEDGHYGDLTELETLSRDQRFKRGAGLPGVVWEVGRPCVMAAIGENAAFFRAPAARQGRLTSALGIPCSCGDAEPTVLCLLSSNSQPIARRYEIWVPTADGAALRQAFAVCDETPPTGEEDPLLRIAPNEGPLGRVWAQRTPLACADLSTETSPPIRLAVSLGLVRLVALPTFRGREIASVVAWYY